MGNYLGKSVSFTSLYADNFFHPSSKSKRKDVTTRVALKLEGGRHTHMTIAYLGDVPSEAAMKAFADLVGTLGPFTVTVSGHDVFGPPGPDGNIPPEKRKYVLLLSLPENVKKILNEFYREWGVCEPGFTEKFDCPNFHMTVSEDEFKNTPVETTFEAKQADMKRLGPVNPFWSTTL